MKQYGTPFYLKIDIEGNDYLCIDALDGCDLPRYVSTEIWGDNDLDRLKVLDRLYGLGYTKFKCISQFDFIALENPLAKEANEYQRLRQIVRNKNLILRGFMKLGVRKLINNKINELETKFRTRGGYTFPEVSSGPFGEDTTGKW